MQHPSHLDDFHLRRVYGISLALALVGGAFLVVYQSPRIGAGFASAGAWSVANLWALERLIRLSVRPTGRRPLAIALALLVKLPVLYGLGALLVLEGGFAAMSLLAGFSIPLLVLVLKAVGRVLAPRIALPDRQLNPHRSRGE